MRRAALLLPFLAASCTCSGPGIDPPPRNDDGGVSRCITDATALAVTPSSDTFAIAAGVVKTQKFAATATMRDGSSRDATNAVNWSVTRADAANPGTIGTDGTWTSAPDIGGVVTVHATDGCLLATAEITITVDAVFNDPGPAVTARFNGTVVSGDPKSPAIVYPNDETRFPVNIYKVLFQWRKNGNEQFRITFQGPNAKATVYSDGAHADCAAATPPSGCYESTLAAWQAIAYSNAGQVVTVTVDGVAANDPNVYRSASIKIGFSKQPVPGAIFYWSTTAAGIRRATVSDFAPEPYVVGKPVPTLLPYAGEVKCVACHSVSRDGKKMIAATEAAGGKSVFVYDVTLQSPPSDYINTGVGGAGHEFGTISPDNRRAVATNRGAMAEYDITVAGRTGPKVADLPLGAMGKGTHPDWSPKGTELIYATAQGDAPAGAGLSVIAYNNGGWGSIRQLAPPNGKTNLFPHYSPDGEWVVYSRGAKGGHGDLTTQLHVIRADGTAGGGGVDLVRANRHVNNTVTAGQFENNQPTWAPPGDLYWVAFNSLRPYGVVFPNGGTQQIWVAAIDPAQLASGQDPSFPAFRFSFQGLQENNHRAFWTYDVRVPDGGILIEVGGDGGTCLAAGAACSQSSGASCCAPSFCDQNPDGGTDTICQTFIIN
jgi:hypothetical protein